MSHRIIGQCSVGATVSSTKGPGPGGTLRYSPCIFVLCFLISNLQAQSDASGPTVAAKPPAQQETV
ncbi:MAG TPA: hypothetical protein VJW55_15680, partial [Candidatus Angelobacter sp.]|nr:hypothetical protein [Candidatus Angelobacter sp.]